METLRKGLDKVLEFVCCTLLALMTIFATWQVTSRYVFNKPSTVTEELVLICFVWMGLLGAAYVFGKQEHMRMSFLVDKLSEKNQTKISTVTEELVLICFVWMGLLGAAYVFGKQEHMRMSFLVDKLSEKNQTKIKLFSEIVVMLFAGLVLVFGGWKMSQLSMGQSSSSLQIPMGYIYLALPLSGVITMIYNALNLSDIVKELSSKETKKELKIAQ